MTATPKPTPSAGPLRLEDVFEEHGAFVYRSLRRLGVHEADVEDATQEVFVVLHRRLPDFDRSRSMKSYLFGIARKVAAAQRRSPKTRHEAHPSEVPAATEAPQQFDEVAYAELRQRLDQALDVLDDDGRAVFVLHELEEVPMKEVAEITDCPLKTAYARLYAARKKVRRALVQDELKTAAPKRLEGWTA